MDNKPKYLYRGMVIRYEDLKDFKFSGVDLKVPYEPIIDSKGRRTVTDGNEYGVYMTDNEQMAKDVYGNVHGGGTAIDCKLKVGDPPEMVMIPDVGLVYRIHTDGLDVHKPWICDNLRGHYNNGFEGEEWITEEIPSQNYDIIRIRIGQDLLHDAEDVKIEDIGVAEAETKRIVEARKQRLELFTKELSKIPENKRRMFIGNEMEVFKEIFGKDGVRYVQQDSIDISSAKGAIKYLMASFYNKNREEIDLKTLGYIEGIKLKLSRTKQLGDIDNLISIITGDMEQANTKKQEFIMRKEQEGEVPNTKGFDAKISMMSEVLQQLQTRIRQNRETATLFSETEIGKATINVSTQKKDEAKRVMESENILEDYLGLENE